MKAGWSMNADEKTPPGSPQEWLRHAESDLLLAKLGADNEDVLTAQVCFHAQQAIGSVPVTSGWDFEHLPPHQSCSFLEDELIKELQRWSYPLATVETGTVLTMV